MQTTRSGAVELEREGKGMRGTECRLIIRDVQGTKGLCGEEDDDDGGRCVDK